MMIKLLASFMRAAGFLGLVGGLFYFLALAGAGSMEMALPCGGAAALSLAAIWGGDALLKRAAKP